MHGLRNGVGKNRAFRPIYTDGAGNRAPRRECIFGGMPIIEGEDIRAYCQLRDQIAARVKPKDILEETRREKARITCTYNTEYW
jgi:hypothetical protein